MRRTEHSKSEIAHAARNTEKPAAAAAEQQVAWCFLDITNAGIHNNGRQCCRESISLLFLCHHRIIAIKDRPAVQMSSCLYVQSALLNTYVEGNASLN